MQDSGQILGSFSEILQRIIIYQEALTTRLLLFAIEFFQVNEALLKVTEQQRLRTDESRLSQKLPTSAAGRDTIRVFQREADVFSIHNRRALLISLVCYL
jgi:hypothetical protein